MPAFMFRSSHASAARVGSGEAHRLSWPPSAHRSTAASCGEDLFDAAGAAPNDRVLVVGGERAEILCAALRRGCRSAIGVVAPERHPAPADLVLAPRVATVEQAAAIGECARRAMSDAPQRRGRLALGLIGAGAAALGRTIARRLRDYGFNRARLRAGEAGGVVLVCDFVIPSDTPNGKGKA